MNDDTPPDIDSLWDYDNPAASEARFREMLPVAGPATRAELLTQIARAQGLQRRFDDAQRTLGEVATVEALSGRPHVRYLLERGRVFNSSGEPDAARPWFEEAYAAAAKAGEAALAIDAAHMLAIVSPPDEALAWNLRALQQAEASADERARRWRGSLLNNIGWSYHAAGDYAAALDYLTRALAFRREQGPAEALRVARWCVARVWRDVAHAQGDGGQVEAALAEQRALLAEYEALGQPSGYVFEEIGEGLLLLGDEAAARPFFAAAYRELSADPWLAAEEPARLERLRALAEED